MKTTTKSSISRPFAAVAHHFLYGIDASPSLYIAISTFHQEIANDLADQPWTAEGIPFPAVVEALAMEITFEVLREAGVRMPRAMGSAISIVGALVLGQALYRPA